MNKKLILKDSIWLVITSIFNRFQGFFLIAFLARLMSPFELGLFNIIQNLLLRGDIVGRLGTDLAISRDGAQIQTRGPVAIGRLFGVGTILNILSGLIILIILLANKDIVAVFWLKDPSSSKWISLAGLSILITLVGNCPWIFLIALKEFKIHSINSNLYIFFKTFISIILTFLYGYKGALASILISQILYFILGFFIVRKPLKRNNIKLRFDSFFKEGLKIFKFGLPIYISHFVDNVVDIPFLFAVSRVGGLSELGFLRIAQTFGQFVTFLSSALSPLVISYLSEFIVINKTKSEYLKSLHFRIIGGLSLYICLIGQILVAILVPLVFGSAYSNAITLSRIELLIGFFVAINAILSQYIVGYGKTLPIALTNIFSTPIKIIFSIKLIPLYSALGFLIANSIYYLINCVVFLWLAFKDSSDNDKKNAIKFSAIFFLSFAFIFLVDFIRLPYSYEIIINSFIILISFFVYLKVMIIEKEFELLYKLVFRIVNKMPLIELFK